MPHRYIVTACLMLATHCALRSNAEESPFISEISLTPMVSWSAVSGTIYAVQRASSLTGDWTNIYTFYSKTNGIYRWAETSGTASNSAFYRVGLTTNNPPGGFVEDFEDASGWSDMPDAAWTNVAASGRWISGSDSDGSTCYAVSAAARAHSGVRYIGHTGSSHGFIELPTTDSPTQLVFWARTGGGTANCSVGVEYHDGFQWLTHAFVVFSGTEYARHEVDLRSLGLPNPGQRLGLHIETMNLAAYIDDIELRTAQ